MKRFYREVGTQQTEGGWQVTLDGRGIKTVKGAAQIVPSQEFALALAKEWDAQGEEIDAGLFKLRDLTDYALDVIADDPADTIATLVQYGETDTLCYRAEPDEPLFERQQQVWEPILAAVEARYGITLTRVSGIIHKPQSESTLAAFRARLEQLSPLALAAMMTLTSLSASLITALEALEDNADAQGLWDAAHLEEIWQAELWGSDCEAQERLEKRRADFASAFSALKMVTA
jgi:chaperone required for assembly of F1-ATPase